MLENVLSRLLHDPISVYLLTGDVVATIAIGFGIIWEHGPPDVRRVANKFVIGGIIAETLCSVLLFAYDANVIGAQNDKIIGLDRKIAPRSLETDELAAFEDELKPFSGQIIDVYVFPAGTPDIAPFAGQIMTGLRKANWQLRGVETANGGQYFVGIGLFVWPTADAHAIQASKALIKALAAFSPIRNLGNSDMLSLENGTFSFTGMGPGPGQMPGPLTLVIGTKP